MPATINGTAGTIQHQTKIGQPEYSTSDKSITLDCNYNNNNPPKGTEYTLSYNFKKGYRYMITISAAEEIGTGVDQAPYLRLDITNNGGGGNTTCFGDQIIVQNLTGNPAPLYIGNLSPFQDYQFAFSSPLPTAYITLEVSAIPATNATSNTIRIRKITIIETPPPPTFALSPDILNIACGSTSPQTFTVTNVYSSPNVTSYDWNLGTANNGWLFNGATAPQNISTTTNSLTLTPDANAIILSNVTVTINLNSKPYQTDTCKVVKINYGGQITPYGQQSICSGSSLVYSLTSALGNNTATWTITPTNAATVQSLAPNGQAVLVTGASTNTNINATLTASINHGCGQVNTSLTIIPNTPLPYTCSDIGDGTCQKYVCFSSPGNSLQLTIPNPNFPNIAQWHWKVTGGIFQGNVTDMYVPWNTASYNIVFPQANTTCIVTVMPVTSCGQESPNEPFKWIISSTFCTSGTSIFKVYPNPASTTLQITSNEKSLSPSSANFDYLNGFSAVEIIDKMGNSKKLFKFAKGTMSADIDISSLPDDNYIIRIFNGIRWESHKLIIAR